MYVDGDEADIEDIIGRSNYVKLINECYSLVETEKLPEAKADSAPLRVMEEVENHFGQKVTGTKFDHFTPAFFLIENRNKLQGSPQLDQALDRFEKIFRDLNHLLPKE